MDKAQVINKLNEIVQHEWKGVVQYTQHSFLVQDLWREVYSPLFRKGADESLHHARTTSRVTDTHVTSSSRLCRGGKAEEHRRVTAPCATRTHSLFLLASRFSMSARRPHDVSSR